MYQHFSKNQPNIQRDLEKSCSICQKQFKFGRNEHQCKRCLRAICGDCGREKILLYKLGFVVNPHRGCKICVEEIERLKEYIQENHLVFGRMSVVGERWLKKVEKNTAYLPGDSKKAQEFKKQVFGRMWDSYNYSMRQFIGMLTFEKPQQDVYSTVNNVVKSVLGVYPKADLESVAYLAIFMLCFCPAEKAILMCLFLIELKDLVTSTGGLITAYLKALEISTEPKIREYIKHIGSRYTASFSVNYAHINSTFYVIDRIITRRKIDEVYIFLALSVDAIKDMIINGKGDNSVSNLLLVRHCSPNTVSSKYRHIASVDSSAFMKQEEQEVRGRHTTEYKKESPAKESLTATYHGQKSEKNLPVFNKNIEKKSQENNNKKNQEDSIYQMNDESNISMISMIQEMKEAQRPNPEPSDGGGQLLAMLSGTVFKPREYSESESETGKTSKQSKVAPVKKPNFRKEQKCEKCQIYQIQIQSLTQELRKAENISHLAQYFQQQNEKLKQKMKRMERDMDFHETRDASSRQNMLVLQKTQLDVQIRRLNQSIGEYQLKLKEYEVVIGNYDEIAKINKRQEGEIKSLQLQLEQSSLTIKMLKNKPENVNIQTSGLQHLMGKEETSLSTEISVSESKIIDILKQNVKDKNIQIEELTKRNKLLLYQLDDANRLNKSENLNTSKISLSENMEVEKDDMVKKMNQLSILLVREEGEKLRLSQENFALRQLLKDNRIPSPI